jgi:hypothetical protein
MFRFLDRHLAAWQIWTGLAAIIALDLSMFLVTVPRLAEFSKGKVMFDLRMDGYSAGQAAHYLDALGTEGRAYYAHAHIPVDMLFAVLEAAVLALIILWFTRPDARFAVPLPDISRLFLIAFPIATAIFDIRENLLITRMLRVEGAPDKALVQAASFATQVKWNLALFSLGIALALAISSVFRARKNARNRSPRM